MLLQFITCLLLATSVLAMPNPKVEDPAGTGTPLSLWYGRPYSWDVLELAKERPILGSVLSATADVNTDFIRGNLFKGKAGIQQEAAYDPATKKYSTKIYPTINNLQVPKDGMTVSFGRDSKTMFGGLEVGWVGAATNAFDSELVKKALKEMDIDMATQTPRTVARGAYNFATGKDCVQLLPKTVDELKIALAYSRVHENPVILQLKDDQTINKGGSLWVFVNYGFPNDPKLQIIDPTTRKQISLQLDTLLPQVAMVMGPK